MLYSPVAAAAAAAIITQCVSNLGYWTHKRMRARESPCLLGAEEKVFLCLFEIVISALEAQTHTQFNKYPVSLRSGVGHQQTHLRSPNI